MDHEVDVGCGVEEKRVGGALRHCKVSAGKSRARGSKSKGSEFMSTCCLIRWEQLVAESIRQQTIGGRETDLAARMELSNSRSASSAARAVSMASAKRCFVSNCNFCAARLGARCGIWERADVSPPGLALARTVSQLLPLPAPRLSVVGGMSLITPVASHDG